jgi:hypothetical protein
MWWLMPPWGPKTRRRQTLALINQWQQEERAAAVRLRLPGVAEILQEPTSVLPVVRPERPLLTRGQAARSRREGAR